MGSLVGHVLPGLGFFLFGLWHLFNNIKLHAQNPHSYTSQPWFPTSKIRYLELFLIMIGSSISISMELFIGPARHHPFDVDGTIPSYHLHFHMRCPPSPLTGPAPRLKMTFLSSLVAWPLASSSYCFTFTQLTMLASKDSIICFFRFSYPLL